MFVKFKQKIADGVEGVSAGRQTPLQGSTEENSSSNDTSRQKRYLRHVDFPLVGNSRLNRNVIPKPRPEQVNEVADVIDAIDATTSHDIISLTDLHEMYKRQKKVLHKYKLKLDKLTDEHKSLQKEKDKLEETFTKDQDKHLMEIKELRETVELEIESKRHLEEVLRVELEEKDDLIHVLRTQINLLKDDREVKLTMKEVSQDMGGEIIKSLQEKLQSTTQELKRLNDEKEAVEAQLHHSEQESKDAMETVRKDMDELLNEVQQLRLEISNLEGKLKDRDVTIMNMKDQRRQDSDDKEVGEACDVG